MELFIAFVAAQGFDVDPVFAESFAFDTWPVHFDLAGQEAEAEREGSRRFLLDWAAGDVGKRQRMLADVRSILETPAINMFGECEWAADDEVILAGLRWCFSEAGVEIETDEELLARAADVWPSRFSLSEVDE